MTSASTPTDNVALSLFQNLRQGMQDGRIPDLSTVNAEVDSAIAELNTKRPPAGDPTHTNDLAEKLLLEIGFLHEKVSKCETQLADLRTRAKTLKEDTSQIVSRTEARGLLVEQQQKENATVLAAVEAMRSNVSTTPPPCAGAGPPSTSPAPCRAAIVSFPGGPRAVTIHPPGSPGYQSVVRDNKGEVIIDFRRTKPLRREGAFRIEDVNWAQIVRFRGGAQGQPNAQTGPDRATRSRAQSSTARPSNAIVARQRQLSVSMRTDAFGRVLPGDGDGAAKSPTLQATSSSQESHSSSSSLLSAQRESESDYTVPSIPTSPRVGRGQKRTRANGDDGADEDEGTRTPVTVVETRTHEDPALLSTPKAPATPLPATKRHGESRAPLPSGRKKMRMCSSATAPSQEGSSTTTDESPSPTRAALPGPELATRAV